MEILFKALAFKLNAFRAGKQLLLVSSMILSLILTTALFSGCSSSKKSKPKSTETPTTTTPTNPSTQSVTEQPEEKTEEVTEALKSAPLMITFSTSNHALMDYAQFKMGLYEIVAYIRSADGTLYQQPLHEMDAISVEDFSETYPLELTHLKSDEYLYHGEFSVVEGTLEKVEVHFDGVTSNISHMSQSPGALIDPFKFAYNNGDNRLATRFLPVQVTTKAPDNFTLSPTEMSVLCIDVDMNMSASLEPMGLKDPDLNMTLFTPSFSLKKMTNSFKLRVKQNNLLIIDKDSLAMGNPDSLNLIASYNVANDAALSKDAATVASLTDISGVYHIDMSGDFSMSRSGYTYAINSASLLTLSEDSQASLYEGKVAVSGAEITLTGVKYPLDASDDSTLFSGVVTGDASALGISDASTVSLWSNGTETKLVATHAADSATRGITFDVRTSINLTPADLLNVKTMDMTAKTITIPSTECTNSVTVADGTKKSDCGSPLTTLDFSKATNGMFSLLETRTGTLTEQTDTETGETDNEIELGVDTVHHFTTANDFLAALKDKVDNNYRLMSLSILGDVNNVAFEASSMAKVILLSPQEALDTVIDQNIASNGTDLGADDNAYTRSAAIAGGALAGLAALAAITARVAERVITAKQVRGLDLDPDKGRTLTPLKGVEMVNLDGKSTLALIASDDTAHSLNIADEELPKGYRKKLLGSGKKVLAYSDEFPSDRGRDRTVAEIDNEGRLVTVQQDDFADTVQDNPENATGGSEPQKVLVDFTGKPATGITVTPITEDVNIIKDQTTNAVGDKVFNGSSKTLSTIFNENVVAALPKTIEKPKLVKKLDDGGWQIADKKLTSVEIIDTDGNPKKVDFSNADDRKNYSVTLDSKENIVLRERKLLGLTSVDTVLFEAKPGDVTQVEGEARKPIPVTFVQASNTDTTDSAGNITKREVVMTFDGGSAPDVTAMYRTEYTDKQKVQFDKQFALDEKVAVAKSQAETDGKLTFLERFKDFRSQMSNSAITAVEQNRRTVLKTSLTEKLKTYSGYSFLSKRFGRK